MNAKQIKENISMEEVLAYFGHFPKVQRTNRIEYLSPFREENVASFFVDQKKNTFKDFGNGYGGSPIDFVMKLKNLSFTESIQFFNEEFSFTNNVENIKKKAAVEIKSENKMILNEVKKLENKNLIEYVYSREIDENIAKEYLKEVYFTIKNKEKSTTIYALGFKNDSGGYEVRNKFYKGNINGKDISYIQKSETKNKLVLFEGFFDFLSYLSLDKKKNDDIKKEDFLILNSSSLLMPLDKMEHEIRTNSIEEKIFHLLKEYPSVDICFDNDKTGKKISQIVKNIHPKVEDKSTIYENYNDFNEYLVNLPKTRNLTI